MGNEREPIENKERVKLNVWIRELPNYVHCGQMIGVRGFDMPKFEVKTDGMMAMAGLTIIGKDARVVSVIMKYVEDREKELGLKKGQTYDLVSKTVDLLRDIRFVTERDNSQADSSNS